MKTVAASLRAAYPNALLVIVPDKGKEEQAEEIAISLNCHCIEMPSDKQSNYDAHDYLLEYGTDALTALLTNTKAAPEPELRFKLLSGVDLSNAPPMTWMLHGVLPSTGLAALYGPSGSGKSFLILDLACALAESVYE
jgi:putative DNA primase/helicase